MTEREEIRYRRKVEREIKVQIYKDIIAVILWLLFFISPSMLLALIDWLEKVLI